MPYPHPDWSLVFVSDSAHQGRLGADRTLRHQTQRNPQASAMPMGFDVDLIIKESSMDVEKKSASFTVFCRLIFIQGAWVKLADFGWFLRRHNGEI